MSYISAEVLTNAGSWAAKKGSLAGKHYFNDGSPSKLVWVRVEMASLTYSGWNGGYSVMYKKGPASFYPEKNVRRIRAVAV